MSRPTLADARSTLRVHFGYNDFRPAQIPAVEAVLAGGDALIVLPTGGGKSLCFQVPALALPGMTVVVSPLISLMADQVQALQARGIAAEYLNSTLPPHEAARRLDRVRQGAVKLLYLAPERLVLPPMLAALAQISLSLLAVDEAHCVSEWGHDFRPCYLRLRHARRALGSLQTVALTATATPRVRRDIVELLELDSPVEVVGGFDRPNLSFAVQAVRNEPARNEGVLGLLRTRDGPAVVYAATRRQVNHVTTLLQRCHVPAVGYHAGLTPERRADAQDAFMRSRVPIIVATNAFGMGIDKADVRLVVHFTMSGSLEDYYQEAGRAGRDGGDSRCVLVYRNGDRGVHDRFLEASYPTPSTVRRVAEALASIRRAEPYPQLDVARISTVCRPTLPTPDVQQAIEYLRDGALVQVSDTPPPRLRLLAGSLRLACELPALSTRAQAIARRLEVDNSTTWQELDTGGAPADSFTRALAELESRQLVYVDRVPPRYELPGGSRWTYRLGAALRRLESLRAAERQKLEAMVRYATTTGCRRQFILQYFGDIAGPCGSCDRCESRSGRREK